MSDRETLDSYAYAHGWAVDAREDPEHGDAKVTYERGGMTLIGYFDLRLGRAGRIEAYDGSYLGTLTAEGAGFILTGRITLATDEGAEDVR